MSRVGSRNRILGFGLVGMVFGRWRWIWMPHLRGLGGFALSGLSGKSWHGFSLWWQIFWDF
jgi:hypothetical protein